MLHVCQRNAGSAHGQAEWVRIGAKVPLARHPNKVQKYTAAKFEPMHYRPCNPVGSTCFVGMEHSGRLKRTQHGQSPRPAASGHDPDPHRRGDHRGCPPFDLLAEPCRSIECGFRRRFEHPAPTEVIQQKRQGGWFPNRSKPLALEQTRRRPERAPPKSAVVEDANRHSRMASNLHGLCVKTNSAPGSSG